MLAPDGAGSVGDPLGNGSSRSKLRAHSDAPRRRRDSSFTNVKALRTPTLFAGNRFAIAVISTITDPYSASLQPRNLIRETSTSRLPAPGPDSRRLPLAHNLQPDLDDLRPAEHMHLQKGQPLVAVDLLDPGLLSFERAFPDLDLVAFDDAAGKLDRV